MQICIYAQLMPLPLTVSCSNKSRLVLQIYISGAGFTGARVSEWQWM